MHHVVDGRSGDDGIEVLREALRRHQALAAAGGTPLVIRQGRCPAVERLDQGFRLHRHLVHRAVSEVDQLLGMAERERRAPALVPGIVGCGRVATLEPARHGVK